MKRISKTVVCMALMLSMLGSGIQPVSSYADQSSDKAADDQVVLLTEATTEEVTGSAQETSSAAVTETPQTESSVEESKETESSSSVEESKAEEGAQDESESIQESSTETEATVTSEEASSAESSKDNSSKESTAKETSAKETSAKETSAKETSAQETTSAVVKPTKKWPLKNGIWRVHSDTDNRMFYIVQDENGNKMSGLIVDGDSLTATITLTGTGYDYLYMGTVEEAEKANRSDWVPYKEVNGYYTYTLKLSALNKKLNIASHSQRLDQWYQHTIIFYSKKAELIMATDPVEEGDKGDGTETKPQQSVEVPVVVPSKKREDKKKNEEAADPNTSVAQSEFENDNKADKVSKYKDDSDKSTSAVDNNTGLKDGVYTPDGFSWSGGSGRLSYIRCNKLTVKGGKVYATIEFGSSKYDQLKANGQIYYKSGSGNATFVIPVTLNKNNKIIGRTTAMSAPHWVEYTIFISKAVDENGNIVGQDEKVKEELAEEAPQILGLETEDSKKDEYVIEHSKYFKIFSYKDGIKLIQVDLTSDTYKDAEEEETASASSTGVVVSGGILASLSGNAEETTAAETTAASEEGVQYDENGQAILKSKGVTTSELYQNQVVNFLVIPEGVEAPAGVEKDFVIINQPADSSFVASTTVLNYLEKLDQLGNITALGVSEGRVKSDYLKKQLKKEKVKLAGTVSEMNYAALVLAKTNLAILPDTVLASKIDKSDKAKLSVEEQKTKAEDKVKQYEELISRFSSLNVPVFVNRSNDETTKLGKAEWAKVYGILYGCEDAANKWYEAQVKKAKKNTAE